jgi:hypothetical protein
VLACRVGGVLCKPASLPVTDPYHTYTLNIMAAPLVGRRVKISGLTGRPELNGTEGLAVSFDDAKGRYNVKLDADAKIMSLKPASLDAADGGAGGGSGGAGGMPGFGGGMPGFGGMPGMGHGGPQAAMLQQLLARLFGGGGGGIPGLAGVPPQALGVGVMLIMFVLPRLLGIGMLQAALIGGLGGFTLLGASGGQGVSGVRTNALRIVRGVGNGISRATGRPLSDGQAALFLAAALYLVWKYLLSSGEGSGGGSGGGGFFGGSDPTPSYAAYRKGYEDGKKGRSYDPVADAPVGNSGGSSSSSRWGIGSLVRRATHVVPCRAGSAPSWAHHLWCRLPCLVLPSRRAPSLRTFRDRDEVSSVGRISTTAQPCYGRLDAIELGRAATQPREPDGKCSPSQPDATNDPVPDCVFAPVLEDLKKAASAVKVGTFCVEARAKRRDAKRTIAGVSTVVLQTLACGRTTRRVRT